MIYKFIDNNGTFTIKDPQRYKLYFPLTNRAGSLLSAIAPNLSGDIKKDNEHFLTVPASIEDLRSNWLCRRDFFIKVNHEVIRLSQPYEDTLEAGFLYQKITKKIKNIEAEILNFIPHNLAVEVMQVKIRNKGAKSVKITPTSFIPLFGRAEKNLRDHRHVSSLLNRISFDKYGILLKPTMVFDENGHKANKTNYFVLGFEGNGEAPAGQFPTLDYFIGEGDFISPDAIVKDIKPVKVKLAEFDGKEVCAAFRFKEKFLKPNQEVNYFLILGINDDPEKIKQIFLKLNSPQKISRSFLQTKNYWLNYLSALKFDFKDRNFDNWLLWVKLQPTLRKLFGCSFLPHFDYGKGGRGWRDLWQDALTLILTEGSDAKKLILNNFQGVRIDGSNATIVTKEGSFISDRNHINRVWMDHGIWPYLTLRAYINKTSGLGLLLKDITYFRDHLLCRASQIDKSFCARDFLLRDKDGETYRGSVLEHVLIENLVQFYNVGSHNIIRLENADWNDGLDMASKKGESVVFSFMYAHNLNDLCFVLEKLKKKHKNVLLLKELAILLGKIDYSSYKQKQKILSAYLEKVKHISGERIKININDLILSLKEKSAHLSDWLREKEWQKVGFFNGYYDNRLKRVEGQVDGMVKMMLSTQVFAIMSGVASDEQIKKIWQSAKKYLQDKELGGFHLNTNFKNIYLELGRAFGFSYGDKENGAFFNHMIVMFAYALYKRGFNEEANLVINSIYNMATSNNAKIAPMIPEYFNAKGQGLYYYLTGSASWFVYTLTSFSDKIRIGRK